jgi:hypothetical protein
MGRRAVRVRRGGARELYLLVLICRMNKRFWDLESYIQIEWSSIIIDQIAMERKSILGMDYYHLRQP